MTREELTGKTKTDLTVIAKTLGIKGISKSTREELIEKIILLDPPISADPQREPEISQYLHNTLANSPLYTPPPPPEHLTGVAVYQGEEHAIPPHYNDTRIVLLVRDPYWLYSYWDVNQETKNRISGSILSWDRVVLMLRVYDITGINFDGTNSNFYFDIHLHSDATNWYIHVGGPNRSFCVDLGFIRDNGEFYTIVRSNMVTTPRDNVSEIIDEEWMIVEDDFNRLYRLAGGGGLGNNSAELVESLIKRLEREMSSGVVSSISSPGRLPPRERKFWMVVNTELIVYGATEPDARVTIQGEPVQLRPDGTFTLRFALPDGIQYLPVQGQSADGVDTITIMPVVSKETR